MDDLINRQDAIDAVSEGCQELRGIFSICEANLLSLPSAQPTLYGYPIEHLVMIARVMEKENCTPEVVAQMLQNAGEIAKMVRDEMMEMLKESVERSCKGVANELV